MSEQLDALARGYAEAREQAKEHGPAVAYGWLAARVDSILAGAGYETPCLRGRSESPWWSRMGARRQRHAAVL